MSHPTRTALAAALALFFAATTSAQSLSVTTQPEFQTDDNPAKKPFNFTAYWENDSKPLKPNNSRDRHYSHGLAISVAHQPDWAKNIAGFIDQITPLKSDLNELAIGYTAGQLFLTPEDITATELITDDRPYAGYLYAGIYLDRAKQDTNSHIATNDRFRLDLGVVGQISQADDFQQEIHDLIDSDFPAGWFNQLEDEPTIQFYYTRKWRIDIGQLSFNKPNTIDIIPQVGFALGTVHRNLNAALTVRAGLNLPNDFGPASLAEPAAGLSIKRNPFYLYGFAKVSQQVVEHNMFLEGNNFTSSHSVDEKLLTAAATFGIALAYELENLTLQAAYSQTFQTDLFDGQAHGDEFASLTISLTCYY